jgi:hypothetical protein
MNGGLKSSESVILQHMKKGGFTGVIKTKEKQLGVLVPKTERGQNIVDCFNLLVRDARSS